MTMDTWCGVCAKNIHEGCKVHKIMRVQDQKPQPLFISSIPEILRIKILKKDNLTKLENFDVCAKKQISSNVQFGPLLCEQTAHESEMNSSFPLVILKASEKLYCSFKNTAICNWMVLIKPALYEEEVNLHAYMSGQDYKIYFITVKTIHRNQELRVWYAEDYAKKIGNSPRLPSHLSSPSTEIPSKRKIKTSQKAKENLYCAVSSADDGEDIDYDPFSSKKSSKKKVKQSANIKSEKLPSFPCKICDLVFRKANVLDIHSLVHDANDASTVKGLTCPDCNEAFTDQTSLINHISKHAIANTSGLSSSISSQKKAQSIRKNKAKQDTFIDTMACIQDNSGEKIDERENNRIQNDLLNETISTESSFTNKNVAILLKPEMSREKGASFCKLCNKSFSTSSAFAVHNKKHSEKRFYDCALCDKSFKLYKELQDHGKNVHVRRSNEINEKLGGVDKVLMNIVGELNNGFMKDLETNISFHNEDNGINQTIMNNDFANIDERKKGISSTKQEKSRTTCDVSSFEVSFDGGFCYQDKLCHVDNIHEYLNVIVTSKNHDKKALNSVLNKKSNNIINRNNKKTKSNEDNDNCENNNEKCGSYKIINKAVSNDSLGSEVNSVLGGAVRNLEHPNTPVEKSQEVDDGDCMIDNTDIQSVESRERSDDRVLDRSLGNSEEIYDCPECHRSFKSFKAISRHVRRLHNGNRYTCPVCGKQLPLSDKLKLHMLSHSSFREFVCEKCGKQFKRKDKLQDHVKRLHLAKKKKNDETMEDDEDVSSSSKTKFVPELPSSDYMKFTFKCYSCHLGFKRRGMLVNHMLKKHPQQSIDSVHELTLPIVKYQHEFYCIYCDKVFKSNNKRKQHILKWHPGFQLPTSLRNSKSKKANLSTPIKSAFSALTGHVAVTPSSCHLCKRQFSTKSKLHQHLRKKHHTNFTIETNIKSSNKNRKIIDKTVQKTRQQNKKMADRVELRQLEHTTNQKKFSFDKFNQQSNLLDSSINEVVSDEKIETNAVETNETDLTGPLIDPTTTTNIPLVQQQQLLLDPFLSNSIYITTPYSLSTNKSYMSNKTSNNILFLSPSKNNGTNQLQQNSDLAEGNNSTLMQQCLLQPSQVILLKEQSFLPDNKSSHQNNINGNALYKDNFSSEGFIIGNNVYNNIT